MSLVFYILFGCLLLYVIVLFWLAFGFLGTPFFIAPQERGSQALTLIICARNEEQHVTACLNSIIQQDYEPSKIQLIFINDASSDRTVQIAESVLKRSQLDYRIISNKTQKGKKQSISYAMSLANNELIVLRE